MAELISFLVLISAGLFLSELFKRFHLPYVVGLILAGVVIGPHALDIFTIDETIEFLGSIGLVFLMFMAGLEIKLSSFRSMIGAASKFAAFNGLIPFAAGFLVAYYFGYGTVASLLLGTIFVSSSIAVIIPTLDSQGLLGLRLGKFVVSATILEDVFSLLLLSFFLQMVAPSTDIPLHIFYIIVFVSLYALRVFIPKARELFFSFHKAGPYRFEEEVRFIFVVLIGTVVFFELLGMHAIIAGFFTGLVLSESIKSQVLKEKVHAISYGLFVPVFFILIGAEMNIGVLMDSGGAFLLVAAVVAVSILSKFLSGWLGGMLSGFTARESALIGTATTPQLSTTLAVAFVGLEMGVLDDKMIAAMIVLSIATTFLGPILVPWLSKGVLREREEEEKKR